MRKYLPLLIAIILIPNAVFAAWTYTQNFNSLSDGDLNGQDSWSGDTTFDVQATVSSDAGKSVEYANAAEGLIQRTITGVTDGTMRIELRKDTTLLGNMQVGLGKGDWGTGSNRLAIVGLGYNLNFDKIYWISAGTSEATIQSFSASTFYTIDIDFDCGTDQYRVRVDEGTYTSFANFYDNGTCTEVTNIIFRKQDGFTSASYWDNVSAAAAAATAIDNVFSYSFWW